MSWHFSRALEEAFSVECSSVGELSALWRSMPTAPDDYSSDKMKGTCHRSPYGTMFVPLTDTLGEELLTWYLGVSRARMSAPLGIDQDSPGCIPGYGRTPHESSEKSGQSTHSSKTLSIYALGDLPESLRILPTWGMMHHGECSGRIPVVPHIGASECGFLPTPTTVGNDISQSMQKWPAHRRLRQALDVVGGGGRLISLREWMMGWPIGWTGSERLATDKFLQWYNWHGKSLDHSLRSASQKMRSGTRES